MTTDNTGAENLVSQLLLLAAGGVLTTLGGFFATMLKARMDKFQEISDMKICLIDDLAEITSVIAKMIETHSATGIISNEYLNSLQAHRESFISHKQKLFIITDTALRKSIRDFYKNLQKKIDDSINTVNSLNPTSPNNTQNVINDFRNISIDANSLEQNIEKYKYNRFFIC